jgi:enoyl-CoA hydratase
MDNVATEPLLIVAQDAATGVGVIQLNRPNALNALNNAIMTQLCQQLAVWAADATVRAVVLAGGQGKAFAAGADVKELLSLTQAPQPDPLALWDQVGQFSKPLIAAVNGLALGGGFELVLTADVIIADEAAQFGFPELSLGVIPGAGGCQRLTRLLGHYPTMAMLLTGQQLNATQALACGLVHAVWPTAKLLPEAMALAARIAAQPLQACMAAKQAVQGASQQGLTHGLATERALFYQLFSTHDQKEGMTAFLEKRPAQFTHQ